MLLILICISSRKELDAIALRRASEIARADGRTQMDEPMGGKMNSLKFIFTCSVLAASFKASRIMVAVSKSISRESFPSCKAKRCFLHHIFGQPFPTPEPLQIS